MSDALDMSLDDIIRNNKNSGGSNGNFRGRGGGRGRGRGFGSGPGPARRLPNRVQARTTPYLAPQIAQVQQMLAIGGGSATESGTKLLRFQLGLWKNAYLRELRKLFLHRQSDALAAVERYNNVHLDGKPMHIELVGVSIVTPAAVPPTTNSILGKPNFTFRRQERPAGRGWDRRGGGGDQGFGRGRGRGRGQGEKVSAEDLDADLEKYHQEAMQIN
ncbi:RNA-binding (RRM/RBD/RNP motifs) family protein [Actinidia rufa]|uniref:RNA-binding (RRM/RBD/RNP motifs) family protein n=1 Tax=Actinidia rufa TaxID=165716 RepID=A0A7J0GVL4_9ERIC|nr:RNA-binding (RRM/RBD/RNP motifs) family protein [Actinidia rufa]